MPLQRFALITFLLLLAAKSDEPLPLSTYEQMLSGHLLPAPKTDSPTPPKTDVVIKHPITKTPETDWSDDYEVTMVTKEFRTGRILVGLRKIREDGYLILSPGETIGGQEGITLEHVEFASTSLSSPQFPPRLGTTSITLRHADSTKVLTIE